MSGVSNQSKKGILRRGWTASVDDYAISGGWSLGGEALMVADASGGIFAFDGKSGDVLWSQQKVHEGSGLATSIHPSGTKFATAGKDGKVLVWDVSKGNVMQTLDAGIGWVENVVWSPDGQWLAASCSRQVRVFNEDGQEIWQSDIYNKLREYHINGQQSKNDYCADCTEWQGMTWDYDYFVAMENMLETKLL